MFQIKPNKRQTIITKTIPEDALQILRNGFFAYFGTSEKRCIPHLTAMFYVWDETTQTIFLVAAKSSRKILNIRKNNRVSVTVDIRDPVNPSENSGVLIRGRAMMIEMELVEETMTLNYLEKYINFLGKGYPLGSRIAIRVTPDILSYWRGIRFFRWTRDT